MHTAASEGAADTRPLAGIPGTISRAIERYPGRAFAAFCALHFVVWTALPAFLYHNLPLDLIEALTYGREWQLGYDKLPPLPWWLVEIAHRTVGHDTAYYALAQIAVIAAFALVWVTALPLVGGAGALAAVLIIDGLHYFHYTAAKFNHDVIQLPFWALAGYAFHGALRRGYIGYWLLLGFALGMAFWAKYFVAVLVLPLAVFLLLDNSARKRLLTPGPWIALAVAIIIALPHLYWLVKNDFLPFAYASMRAAPSRGLLDHLLHPATFALAQVLFLIPAFLIAAPLLWSRSRNAAPPAPNQYDRHIVTLLAFGPAATTIALSAITGRGTFAMWGYPLWLFLGLWIVIEARISIDARRLTRMVAAWSAIFVVFALVFLANYSFLPNIDHRYRAAFFPGDRLAEEIARGFRAATGRPLVYVIGTMWEGGNVAHYALEHPRVLIDGDPRRAPWIDLGDLRSKGAVVVWTCGENIRNTCATDMRVMPPRLRTIAGEALVQPPFTLPFRRGDMVLHVGWAILPPSPAFAAS